MKFTLILATFFFISTLFGQDLIDFSLSSCSERSYPEFIRNRVIYTELNEEILTVRLGLVLNCCADPNLRLNYKNDSLFVQIEDTASLLCMCKCCFEVTIRASGIPNTDFTVIYEKEGIDIDDNFATIYTPYELEENSYKYAFPSPGELHVFEQQIEELNQFTDDEKRIGLWRFSKGERNYMAFYKVDKNGESRTDWWVRYDQDGELTNISGYVGLSETSSADKWEYYRLFGVDVNDD